ncbi:MAG: hypothetical protein II863_19185 [Kiritimatiellae bacterium]|nr:hypothetical protein [Kiritimatiellia bacterium]
MKTRMLLVALAAMVVMTSTAGLYEDFVSPPAEVKVGCYYYWVNECVDEDGVKQDLEWMKENGITRAFLATDISNYDKESWPGQLYGKNEFMSEHWWRCLRTAFKTAGELGIEMGIFNCPGWSQSGGPWINPEEAMRNYNPTNGVGWEVSRNRSGGLQTNGPCSPKATGLEVDKLSAKHVRKHFDSFIGEILRRIPKEDRPTLTTLVIDSWECGTQNYTDDIFKRFKARFGYELDYADAKCKKDLKTLLAELVASEYIGTLTKCAHENGLITWCEPYAHSPTIMNGISYGAAADEVSAEFWASGRDRVQEIRNSVGAARASGKNKVYAESFTCGDWHKLSAPDEWSFDSLKWVADKFFHQGVNATILHVVISQPGDENEPPVRPWFGTFFDRRSKNAADTKRLVGYCRRCNFMLQAGKPHDGKPDERILDDGTVIRFTSESLFEVSFPDGRKELWNPVTCERKVVGNAERIKAHITADARGMFREAEGDALIYPYLTPGSKKYASVLWDWDSWFSDVALRQTMADLGDEELRREAQKYERGCILNYLAYTDPDDGYMPILISSGSKRDRMRPDDIYSENMHKPCLAQHAAFLVREDGGDAEWLREVFGRLEAFMKNYRDHRRHAATGLYVWQDDLAIGVDNDPSTYFRPKNSSASIFLNSLMYKELKAMAYLAQALGLAERAAFYADEAEALGEAVRTWCWDEKDAMFYSCDVNLLDFDSKPRKLFGGEMVLHKGAPRSWPCLVQRIGCWSGFAALWAGIATPEQARKMASRNLESGWEFLAPYGIRTLSKYEKMYNVKGTNNPSNWLGPVWGIANYMVWRGLVDYGLNDEARKIAESEVRLFGEDLAANGALHEYYDGDTGKGIINKGFQNWNYLALNMVAWLEGRPVVNEF